MAKIYPFRAIRYNQAKVKDLSNVVCPPYDVIYSKDQEGYYRQDPYNVVRLILGKEFPDDDPAHNRYARAYDFFVAWLKEGILKQDKEPSIYIYSQRYRLNREEYERCAFICLVRLEDFGQKVVFPHEKTFPKPKEDRLKLIRATRANLSPIFALYQDKGRIITRLLTSYLKSEPLLDLEDNDEVRHRLWAITDMDQIDKIVSQMKRKPIFIADGHHRYETALAFRDEMKAKTLRFSGKEPFNRMMVCLVDMDDKGLIILPTHRLVRGIVKISIRTLKKRLSSNFSIKQSSARALFSQMRACIDKHVFGMYHRKKYYLLTLKDEGVLDEIVDPTKPIEWKRLDVTILSSLILESCLGIGSSDENVGYTKDRSQARALVDSGRFELAFFLNPVSPEQVKLIAFAHQLMPPKSTYFYPKLLTGLVMNKFSEDIS